MNVLISIKPKYVKNIINKSKKYEYRKQIFKYNVDNIYIYSSFPEKKIIGYFKYSGCIFGDIYEVWEKTKDESGISQNEYFNYYDSKNIAYAIIINDIFLFSTPYNPYLYDKDFHPPQSFMYIQKDFNL